jgi:hypothetical protein
VLGVRPPAHVTYAAYLNLIEPWWKTLRSLALKGRRFETWEQICDAIARAPPTGMLIVILSSGDAGGGIARVVYLRSPSLLMFVNLVDAPQSVRRKPFPMAFGDHFDCSADHFEGVNSIRWHIYPGARFTRVIPRQIRARFVRSVQQPAFFNC